MRRWIKPGASRPRFDLATGSGDIPRLIADCARQIAPQVEITLWTNSLRHWKSPKLSIRYPEICYREANILEWHSVETYDVVLCTLALHHFNDEDAVVCSTNVASLSRKSF